MGELDHNEGWALKNWCLWTVVSEKTPESPVNCREIKPVNPKENQPEYSLEGWCWSWSSNILDTWCKELTHWKRHWCWERLKEGGEGGYRGRMVGWHHWLNGHEFEQTLGYNEGQGSLVCCSPMGSQRVIHDLLTEQQRLSLILHILSYHW